MSYYFKQKFKVTDLLAAADEPKRVLISLPEEDLSNLYATYFQVKEFLVAECQDQETLFEFVRGFEPHLLILGTDLDRETSELLKLVNRTTRLLPYLPLITVGYGLSHEVLKKLMSAGVAGYIDRRFSRPLDIVIMAKALLNV